MRVTTPVAGFTGEVVGVHFVDGVAETSDPRAIAYFARRGYLLEDEESTAPDEDSTEDEESTAPDEPEQPSPRVRRRA